MWSVESTATVAATPSEVWALYADPASWGTWAHSTIGARSDGGLEVGREVVVDPGRGPEQRVRVVTLDPERRLETELRLPGASMRFGYEIEAVPGGARIRHEVSMSGPLSWLYGLLVRRRNRRELAHETRRLEQRFERARAERAEAPS